MLIGLAHESFVWNNSDHSFSTDYLNCLVCLSAVKIQARNDLR